MRSSSPRPPTLSCLFPRQTGSLSIHHPAGAQPKWDRIRCRVTVRYFFGQGTLMLTVEVSPLRYLSSVFAGKPPFGHFFGTVP